MTGEEGRLLSGLSHPLPSGYSLRAPVEADVPSLVALEAAVDIERFGESDVTEAEIVEDLALPRLDLAQDVWLVEAPSRSVVGWGLFWMENPPRDALCWQLVHPGHRGRGILETLLELGEMRAAAAAARSAQPVSLGTFTDAGDTGQLALFARHGFVPAREFLRMQVTFEAAPPAPAIPPGIQVRGFRRGRDEAAVHAAMDEAFKDHFRPPRWDLDEWQRLRFSRSDLDLGLWWVAWDGEEVAGSVLAFALPTGGYVDELGVRRPWRGRGLGRALLLQAFAGLYERGVRRMFLGVDSVNPTGARRIYESVGMTPTRRDIFVAKDMAP